MLMIPIQNIRGKDFTKARTLMLPVIVVDALTLRIPSSSPSEKEHRVRFDSAVSPAACGCTCEKGEAGEACWAMARALGVMTLFGVHNVLIGREAAGTPSTEKSPVSLVVPLARAIVAPDGVLELMYVGAGTSWRAA